MKDYPQYHATADDAITFIDSQRIARLVTVSADGWPRIGVHVFVHDGLNVEMHLLEDDPHLEDIRNNGRALIEIDEPLANARSEWVDASDATNADQYYRCVVIRAAPVVVADRAAVVGHLTRVLARYQPGASHTPLEPAHSHYETHHPRLRVVRLAGENVSTTFRLAQRTQPAALTRIIDGLKASGTELEVRTADALEAANQSRLRGNG